MTKHRVTVILSEDELAHVRTRAGLVPLSTWFRNLAMGPQKISDDEDRIVKELAAKLYRVEYRSEVPDSIDESVRQIQENIAKGLVADIKLAEGEQVIPETGEIVEAVATPKRKKQKPTCKHGKEQGYNCWQCGGLAKTKEE